MSIGERRARGHGRIDWESGIVLLNGDKTAGLELPTFDPLACSGSFIFAPPSRTKRNSRRDDARVYHSRFHRTG